MVAVAYKQDFTVQVQVYAKDTFKTAFSPLVMITRPGEITPVGIVTSQEFSSQQDAERHGHQLAEAWLKRADW